jgi:hypothetical protein
MRTCAVKLSSRYVIIFEQIRYFKKTRFNVVLEKISMGNLFYVISIPKTNVCNENISIVIYNVQNIARNK